MSDMYDGKRVYGPLKGIVTAIDDRKAGDVPVSPIRRVEVRVPMLEAGDEETPVGWADICDGFHSNWLPSVGDLVWVQFENGYVDFPVVMGLLCAVDDITPEFLAKYSDKYREDYDANGNIIKWTDDKGKPAGKAITINGEKRLLREEFMDFVGTILSWLSAHKHMGNSGVPTPLYPDNLTSITAKIAEFNTKKVDGQVFGTNKFLAE
jgi:hypothetical protein